MSAVILSRLKGVRHHGSGWRTLGLAMAGLFTERIDTPHPDVRRTSAEAWRAALGVLDREAALVQLAANNISTGQTLSPNDGMRAGLAAERMAQAREILRWQPLR